MLLILVATPLVALTALGPGQADLAGLAAVAGLVGYPVCLVAAVLVYFHWRLSDDPMSAWLVLLLTLMAAPGLALTAVLAAGSAHDPNDPGWALGVQLIVGVAQLVVVTLAGRRDLRRDPFTIGLGVGLLLAAAVFALVTRTALPALTHERAAVLALLLVLLQVAVTWQLLRLSSLDPWGRGGVAVATVTLALSHAAAPSLVGGRLVDGVAVVCAVAGALVLVRTSLVMLRSSVRDSTRALSELHQHVDELATCVRVERARLHEIGSTVAGITSASRLIREGGELSDVQRTRLADMVDSELARLERLLLRRDEQAHHHEVDLDHVLSAMVTSQEARGHPVAWAPTGWRVRGRTDDVTELIHILLDNAAKHGDASGAVLTVSQNGATVEIAVSNTGPGVPPDALETLFDWGVRGPRSGGQGIGLHIAHRLAEEHGGYLRHVDVPGVGTTFVVGLEMAVSHEALGQSA